jgi:hypothetical protein
MILNTNRFIYFFVTAILCFVGSSCVEIPDKAPDAPILQAQFRFVSMNPSNIVTPPSIEIAEGPSFATYKSYAMPPNTTPTDYMTFNAGSKKIVYNNGIQNDTLVVTFETDQRATLVFARNRTHDSVAAGLIDPIKMPYRYIFATNGIADTTLVRFTNLVLNATDTIDVFRSDSTFGVARIVVDNLRFGLTSGQQTGTSLVKIPAGKTYKFFFTHSSMNANTDSSRVFKDSVEISGISRKIYSVFVYDKFDSTLSPRNANVKVKMLEEL